MKKYPEHIAALALTLVFALLLSFGALQGLENQIYDRILQSPREADRRIVIVGIDERSLSEIGRWPWPRGVMALFVHEMARLDAAAVGIDVLYDLPGPSAENDAALAAAIAANGRVVLASFGELTPKSAGPIQAYGYAAPISALMENAKPGHINVLPETDGVLRKALRAVRYHGEDIFSFAAQLVQTYAETTGQAFLSAIPADEYGLWPIRFVGKPGSFTAVSFAGVLAREYPEGLFKNAIVLVGPYTVGLGQDLYYTPQNRQTAMYGVEIHANTVQNLLENDFTRFAPLWTTLLNLLIFAALALLLFRGQRPFRVLLALIFLAAAQLALAKFLYEVLKLIIPSVYILALLAALYLLQLIAGLIRARREKARIQGLFGRYVAPEVVGEIVSGGIPVALGGTLREISVLFVDIRGFTPFSESNSPERVVAVVNRYLNLTSNAVLKNGGTIDKYIGDATMAIWGAPLDLPGHALHAVKAALAMQKGAAALCEELERDYGVRLGFGIGVNTGPAIVGNIGSDFRMDYTAIGDTVNTAARLESVAKAGEIIVTHVVYDLVKDAVLAVALDAIALKGKEKPVSIYRVEGLRETE